MTAPIQEPNLYRHASGLQWGQNQLFRRPGPPGTAPMQIFRAARYLTNITVPGPSQIIVDWDYWEYCEDAGIYEPLNTALGPALPGQQVRRVELDIVTNPGRYTFFFGAIPANDILGSTEIAMHDGDLVWGWEESVIHGSMSGGLSGGFMIFNQNRVYPLLDPFGSGTQVPQISWTLAQNSASSEDFITAIFEIHYEPNVEICVGGS
jgi:hypothetical protein